MEPALQTILESLPEKQYRSKLEPHRELIRELRRKGRTYRDLARIFQERLGLCVAPSTIHSFVKVRAKHHEQTQFEIPPLAGGDRGDVLNSTAMERIAAFKAQPSPKKEKRIPFEFHENEPLKLSPGGESK